MATLYDQTNGIVITDDDARGGVTGHNVRYVLAAGLSGAVAALTGIAIYFGFDRLQANAAAVLAQSPYDVLQAAAPYVGVLLAGTIAAGFLSGIWNLAAGRAGDGSQAFMRFRVVAQFAMICVIMAMLYISAA